MSSSAKPLPLSPRQQFQNQVRSLSSEDVRRHNRKDSISLNYNPYELERVGSLRVSPSRKTPYKAIPSSLRQVIEEPDFGSEERDVWSSRSPVGRLRHAESSIDLAGGDFTAYPSQQSEDCRGVPALRRHSFTSADLDDRPRTRRGPEGPSAFESYDRNDHLGRRPKFTEGTMTSRSAAVASSWSDIDYVTSSSEVEDTDVETTPRAMQRKRSKSIDLRDFQPPALTPSTTKRTLFRRTHRKTEEPSKFRHKKAEEIEEAKEKPKKRIRKSMSRLQVLGEKMKIFGSSSHDLSHDADSSKSQAAEAEKTSVMDERKRKAEVVYAEQFGYKRQRDNSGQANVTNSPDVNEFGTTGGNQKYDSSTVRFRGGSTKSRRISTGSIEAVHALSHQPSMNEHDIRKRPSRRELEKENQQLRALLRESQVIKTQEQPDQSDSEALPPVKPLRLHRRNSTSSGRGIACDDGFTVSQDENTPPVPPLPPQHPDRKVLSSIGNSHNRRTRRQSFGVASELDEYNKSDAKLWPDPLQNTPKLIPTPEHKRRSMSPRHSMPSLPNVIVEEPEDEADERKRSLRSRNGAPGKENTVTAATTVLNKRNEEWQWPDDVF